jgi:hypothetical protein
MSMISRYVGDICNNHAPGRICIGSKIALHMAEAEATVSTKPSVLDPVLAFSSITKPTDMENLGSTRVVPNFAFRTRTL